MTDTAVPSGAHPPISTNDEGLALRELAHVVWRRKVAILLSTVLFAALGLLVGVLNTRYQSEGLLLMPSVSVGGYKRYEAALFNEPRLREFLERSGNSDTSAAELLLGLLKDRSRLTQAVRPEFVYTERDARQFGVRMDGETPMLGVRLELTERQRVKESPLRILAEYVRDTAIKIDLEARLLRWCQTYQTREFELRSAKIDTDFATTQQHAKVDSLREIIKRTPGAQALDGRQVISIESGGERFLSPVAQIVAAEVLIAEYELAQQGRERQLGIARLKQNYYCRAREVLDQPITGRAFLASLDDLREKTLAGRELPADSIERVRNTFEVQRHRWQSTYLDSMRFVAAPEGAQVEVRKPSLLVGALVGGLLGVLVGVGLALFRVWWRRNREVIVSDDD